MDTNLLQLEQLKDHTSGEETRDLVALLTRIAQSDRPASLASTKISVGCHHIIRMLKMMYLEGNFRLQNIYDSTQKISCMDK